MKTSQGRADPRVFTTTEIFYQYISLTCSCRVPPTSPHPQLSPNISFSERGELCSRSGPSDPDRVAEEPREAGPSSAGAHLCARCSASCRPLAVRERLPAWERGRPRSVGSPLVPALLEPQRPAAAEPRPRVAPCGWRQRTAAEFSCPANFAPRNEYTGSALRENG